MPFLRMLDEADFTGAEQPTPGEAQYVPADEYRYSDVTEELSDSSKATLKTLREIGATEFRVNYDGGCDEGFAHPDSVVIRGQTMPAAEVLEKFGFSGASKYSSPLDDLADDFAARLLGSGYGTGEYTMYGAFSVNLATLEMTDDPKAQPLEIS